MEIDIWLATPTTSDANKESERMKEFDLRTCGNRSSSHSHLYLQENNPLAYVMWRFSIATNRAQTALWINRQNDSTKTEKKKRNKNPHTNRWFRRKKRNSNEEQPPKYFANTPLPIGETKKLKQKKARAHTQLLCSMNRVTFLSQMLSTNKNRRTVSRLVFAPVGTVCGAFLKVPIFHKFAIIHSSDSILVFRRLCFIVSRVRLAWALSLYLLFIGHNYYCYYSAGHKVHLSAQQMIVKINKWTRKRCDEDINGLHIDFDTVLLPAIAF